MESFAAEPGLRDHVDVLSLSSDPEGRVYVSTVEHRSLPLFATQWHPEKNSFEWGDKLHIPHAAGAVEVTHAGEQRVARWRGGAAEGRGGAGARRGDGLGHASNPTPPPPPRHHPLPPLAQSAHTLSTWPAARRTNRATCWPRTTC